jgi:hypothetical protein
MSFSGRINQLIIDAASEVVRELLADGTTFSTKLEHDRQGNHSGSSVAGWLHVRCRLHYGSWPLDHFRTRGSTAANSLQSQASRKGRWNRLPLLPHQRRGFGLRGPASDGNLHELSFPDLVECIRNTAHPR